MAENAQEALEELLEGLRDNRAHYLAEEIRTAISRGATEEIEVKGRVKELSQRALRPEEAYKLAIEMFVASLEPALMKKHILKNMGSGDDTAFITWERDFVEKSPVAPESGDIEELPEIKDSEGFENDLRRLLALMEEI